MGNLLTEKATEYISYGLSVIPVKSDKSPAIIHWKPFQETKMTNGDIHKFFSKSFATGIGIVTGMVSGNLEVLDIDLKNDKTGTLGKELKQLIRDNLPDVFKKLVVIVTKNAGLHLYYRRELVKGNQKLAMNSEGEVLIETRGEGGYVVGPPSPGYKMNHNDYNKIPFLSEEECEELFAIVKSFDETVKTEEIDSCKIENHKNSPFDDYNAKVDVSELLMKHGWKMIGQHGNRIYFKRPGKEGNAVSANWHIEKRVFYNFSSSTIFEAGKGYSPVGVFTVLECGGDFTLASCKLVELGYGQQVNNEVVKLPPTPSLPISGFPEFVQVLINSCVEVYKTPRDYWAASVISAVGLAIGDKLELITRYQNIPILWVGIIGSVSSGKTEAQRTILQPFHNLDKKLYKEYKEEVKEYKRLSKLSEEQRLAEGVPFLVEPKRFQYLLNDYTPEALAKVHSINNRGLMIDRDELLGWLDDFNRYNKSGEQSFMLSSYNRVSKSINRKNSEDVVIPNPIISIIGGIQPELLFKLAKNDGSENGFLARFCFAYPDNAPKQKYSKRKLPDEIVANYEIFIVALTNLSQNEQLYLSNEAECTYEEWFNENVELINSESNEYVSGVYGKLDIIALRIAIVIKGMKKILENDFSNLITNEIMKTAIEITEYFRATALKVYRKIFGNDKKIPSKREVIEFLYYTEKKDKAEIARILGVSRQRVQNVLRN
ncbi:MAG TPA: hypothetical protein DHV28_16460 [Ignavibacteriales bacterium]|nr:hypothetical protein [Ignavibacteriales bacterium]